MVGRTSDWRDELGRWLEPFVERLGHKARRRMCPLYVAGLIGPGDRKSVQPMAERVAPGDYDQLHHFSRTGSGTQLRWSLNCLSKPTSWSAARCGPGHRRHGVAEEGHAFGRGRAAIRVGAGQDRQLPDPGVADAGARRGPGDGGVATVPARELDQRSSSARARRRSGRISHGADQVGDCACRDRSPDRRRRSLRLRPGRRRVRHERAVPSGVERTRACLGGRHPPSSEGLPSRRRIIFPVAGRGRPRKRHVPDVLSLAAEDMLAQAKWRMLAGATEPKDR